MGTGEGLLGFYSCFLLRDYKVKLAQITDPHLFSESGHHDHPLWPHGLERLIERLKQQLTQKGVEHLLLGGDLVASKDPTAPRRALELFKALGISSTLTLGNHDLLEPHSIESWCDAATCWPDLQLEDSWIERDTCDLIFLRNLWYAPDGRPGYHFLASSLGPGLYDHQYDFLEEVLGKPGRKNTPAILCVHVPVLNVDPRYGMIATAYSSRIKSYLRTYRRLRLIIAGHNHRTLCSIYQDTKAREITTARVTEAPFSWRLVEVDNGQLSVTTQDLLLPEDGIDFTRNKIATGTDDDRNFSFE